MGSAVPSPRDAVRRPAEKLHENGTRVRKGGGGLEFRAVGEDDVRCPDGQPGDVVADTVEGDGYAVLGAVKDAGLARRTGLGRR